MPGLMPLPQVPVTNGDLGAATSPPNSVGGKQQSVGVGSRGGQTVNDQGNAWTRLFQSLLAKNNASQTAGPQGPLFKKVRTGSDTSSPADDSSSTSTTPGSQPTPNPPLQLALVSAATVMPLIIHPAPASSVATDSSAPNLTTPAPAGVALNGAPIVGALPGPTTAAASPAGAGNGAPVLPASSGGVRDARTILADTTVVSSHATAQPAPASISSMLFGVAMKAMLDATPQALDSPQTINLPGAANGNVALSSGASSAPAPLTSSPVMQAAIPGLPLTGAQSAGLAALSQTAADMSTAVSMTAISSVTAVIAPNAQSTITSRVAPVVAQPDQTAGGLVQVSPDTAQRPLTNDSQIRQSIAITSLPSSAPASVQTTVAPVAVIASVAAADQGTIDGATGAGNQAVEPSATDATSTQSVAKPAIPVNSANLVDTVKPTPQPSVHSSAPTDQSVTPVSGVIVAAGKPGDDDTSSANTTDPGSQAVATSGSNAPTFPTVNGQPANISPADQAVQTSSVQERVNVANQVAGHVAGMQARAQLLNGPQHATVQIQPPHWGEMKISVTVQSAASATNGVRSVDAVVTARSESVRDAILSHDHDLRSSLEAAGLKLDKLSVVVNAQSASGMDPGQSGKQDSPRDQQAFQPQAQSQFTPQGGNGGGQSQGSWANAWQGEGTATPAYNGSTTSEAADSTSTAASTTPTAGRVDYRI